MKFPIQPCRPYGFLTSNNPVVQSLLLENFESFGGIVRAYTDGYADLSIARQCTDRWGTRRVIAVQTITLDPAGYVHEFHFARLGTRSIWPLGIIVSNDKGFTIRYKPKTAYMALDGKAKQPVVMVDPDLKGHFRPEEVFYPPIRSEGRIISVYPADMLIHPRSKPMPAAQALALL